MRRPARSTPLPYTTLFRSASQAKGLVKRDVVRLMTPGTLTDDPLLDGRSDNYLAAVAFGVSRSAGYKAALCWAELSRSEEHTSELQSHSDLVCRLLLEKKK